MPDKTAIEWTDATWNPLRGCSRVSEGCRHCYAEGIAARFSGEGLPYEGLASLVQRPDGSSEPRWTGKIAIASERTMRVPLHWGKPRRIFVNSMSDLFHENVPDEVIDRVFAIAAFCPHHTFQILTKRPERMRSYFQLDSQAFHDRQFEAIMWVQQRSRFGSVRDACEHHGVPWHQPTRAEDRYPLRNVWLGVSVEDQVTADTRVPYLLQTPAVVRFLSCEPLLGPIDLGEIIPDPFAYNAMHGVAQLLHWVIVGGESGRSARPMHPDWARSLRDQCAAAGVPFLFKQWGEWAPGAEFHADPSARRVYRGEVQTLQIGSRTIKLCIPTRDDDSLGPALTLEQYGKRIAGRQLDGSTHDEFPEVRL